MSAKMSGRQAIKTEYFGATNFRGARIKASAEAGHVWMSWDYDLGVSANHEKAALALQARYSWTDSIVGGCYGDCYYWVSLS